MKKFYNIPNELITKNNIGNREFFNSRSVAVVATIIISVNGQRYVLMGKRGKGTPDFQGYWNMPCGYLDWSESATEAVYREVYEETGLDLENYISSIETKQSSIYCMCRRIVEIDMVQPWYVQHEVTSNRQNVTLRFGLIVASDELPELTNAYCEHDEVEELAWVNIENIDNYKCAFGHNHIIKEYLDKNGLI